MWSIIGAILVSVAVFINGSNKVVYPIKQNPTNVIFLPPHIDFLTEYYCCVSPQVVDELPEDHVVKTKYLRACYGKPTDDGEEPKNDEQPASS